MEDTENSQLPVFIRASILGRSLLFRITGVSFKSTSLKFPLEPFDAQKQENSDVVSVLAMSIASLASVGKSNRANATAMHKTSQHSSFLSVKKAIREAN